MIHQQVNAAPAPPRAKNPAVSENLEGLILSLLAKKPDARPSSGRAIAQALHDEVELIPSRAASTGPCRRRPAPTVSPRWPSPRRPRAQPATPAPPVPAPLPAMAKIAVPLVRDAVEEILNEPLILTPNERYLCGHYLAFLLGGSRRRGLFLGARTTRVTPTGLACCSR